MFNKKSRDNDSFLISETGNWNIADSYAKSRIAWPMINCDFYKDLAIYGSHSVVEDILEKSPKDEVRLAGLKRYIDELIKLCYNTKFAMKKIGTEKELEKIKQNLKLIKTNILQHTYKKYRDDSQNITTIRLTPLFEKVLEAVIDLESNMMIPLNKNHLIFVDKEEFDPKKFKEQLKERIIHKG